jgi:hypothetical protein
MARRTTPTVYRHGDVIVMTVDEIPASAKRRNHLVLAHGEMTGHSHRIAERGAAEVYESGGETYLRVVKEPATLVHDEHASIPLTIGAYRFWKQREYSPEAIREIRD